MRRKRALAITVALSLAACAWLSPAPIARAAPADPFLWHVSIIPDTSTLDLSGITATGPTDAWAACSVPAPAEGRVYRYDGLTWRNVLSGAPPLYSVSAVDPSNVWAVGASGCIRFWDGKDWRDQSVPGGEELVSVCALDGSHVWVAARSGNVLFFDGASWSTTPVSAGGLNCVTALDARHAWAAGPSGALFAWDGSKWHDRSIPGAEAVNGLSALDTNCVWAAGDNGQLHFWDGYTWKNRSVPAASEKMKAIFALDVNHVFAASVMGHIYFFDGATWRRLLTSTANDFSSVTATDTDHVYLVGDDGLFVWGYSTLEAQTTKYYFAEGTCRPAFDSYICIQNPHDSETARVRVTYMRGNGKTATQNIEVSPASRSTITVRSVLGTGEDAAHDFSAIVESTNDVPVVAERPMYFSYRSAVGAVLEGGSDSAGALRPRPSFYFAEGSCRPAFDPYFSILNPGAVEARVTIDYMLASGDAKQQEVTVPPNARRTVEVKRFLGSSDDAAHDFSAVVRTTNRTDIVAERPMYFDYTNTQGARITGGHNVVGASTPRKEFYFAEGTCRTGFDSYVCIQNPGADEARVRLTYMRGDGSTREQSVAVPGGRRRTVLANDELGTGDGPACDFSVKVEATNGARIVAERPVYFDYRSSAGPAVTGGHCVIGAPYPAGAFYFAEGTCRPDFDSYLCIQNPASTPAHVQITYMRGDGTQSEQHLEVPPRARSTVSAKDVLGSADSGASDFSARVSTGGAANIEQVVVERSMYFNYASSSGGRVTGGHDVAGYSP